MSERLAAAMQIDVSAAVEVTSDEDSIAWASEMRNVTRAAAGEGPITFA